MTAPGTWTLLPMACRIFFAREEPGFAVACDEVVDRASPFSWSSRWERLGQPRHPNVLYGRTHSSKALAS